MLGLFAFLALVVGCGGGNGSEQASISKVAFVRKGSAICLATRRGIRADFEAFTRGSEGQEVEEAEKAKEMTPEEAAAQVGKEIIVPAMRQELEELRALGIPPGDGEEVQALLEAFEGGLEKAETNPDRAAIYGTEAFGRSGRRAAAYGLEDC